MKVMAETLGKEDREKLLRVGGGRGWTQGVDSGGAIRGWNQGRAWRVTARGAALTRGTQSWCGKDQATAGPA